MTVPDRRPVPRTATAAAARTPVPLIKPATHDRKVDADLSTTPIGDRSPRTTLAFNATAAGNLRYAYRIGSPNLLTDDELTARAIATRLVATITTSRSKARPRS